MKKVTYPTLELDPQSLVRLHYDYDNIVMGNALNYKLNTEPQLDNIILSAIPH